MASRELNSDGGPAAACASIDIPCLRREMIGRQSGQGALGEAGSPTGPESPAGPGDPASARAAGSPNTPSTGAAAGPVRSAPLRPGRSPGSGARSLHTASTDRGRACATGSGSRASRASAPPAAAPRRRQAAVAALGPDLRRRLAAPQLHQLRDLGSDPEGQAAPVGQGRPQGRPGRPRGAEHPDPRRRPAGQDPAPCRRRRPPGAAPGRHDHGPPRVADLVPEALDSA